MSLQDWLKTKQLQANKTSQSEIRQLMAVFERDIADAQSNTISIDRRFATAYNAALMISVAALAVSGYRAAGEGHHYWTIQSLAFTLQLDSETVEQFNRFRRKRNTSDYERSGLISKKEMLEMLELAKGLRIILEKWLRKNHPDLI